MDMFKFEREGLDFPLYNDKSVRPVHIIAMLAGAAAILLGLFLFDLGMWGTCALILIGTLVPFLWAARGRIGAVIKAPKLADIPLILGMLLLGFVFATIVSLLMQFVLGMQGSAHPITHAAPSDVNFSVVASMALQLVGEEMLIVNILVSALWFVYQKTGNRKQGVIVGIVASLLVFSLAHIGTYDSLLQILLIQGVGHIFCLFGYLKTKNLLVSYTIHLLNNMLPILAVISGLYATM